MERLHNITFISNIKRIDQITTKSQSHNVNHKGNLRGGIGYADNYKRNWKRARHCYGYMLQNMQQLWLSYYTIHITIKNSTSSSIHLGSL